MDSQLDSESYWNRSTSKAFSFDDDDDENDDVIKGSGANMSKAAGSFSGKKWDSISILNDDTISEASFDNSSNFGPAINLSINSVISEEALKCLLQEQTLDEKVIPKGVAPEVELKLLRRQIQTTLYSPSPEATAQKLLLGKQCTLDVFKSLHEKEQLLDTVIANGGGDGIIAVLLFLRKTLNASKFRNILQQRPKALQHYISYLNQRQSAPYIAEACDLLNALGKHHDAAMLEYKMLHQRYKNTVLDLPLKQQKLRELLERYSSGPTVIGVAQQIFRNELKLLEFIAKERSALDNHIDADSTPIEVLHACCRKHCNWQEHDAIKSTSPFRICAELQISPAQFEWTALNERATQQAYADLQCVFERVPTWLPLKQKKFHISFSLQTAILRLYQLEAPASVLYLFLAKIGNANEKLVLAQRVKCVKAAIDALGSLKDVAELTRLKETLPERSEEQFYCDKILKGLQSKRWTTDGIKIKL